MINIIFDNIFKVYSLIAMSISYRICLEIVFLLVSINFITFILWISINWYHFDFKYLWHCLILLICDKKEITKKELHLNITILTLSIGTDWPKQSVYSLDPDQMPQNVRSATFFRGDWSWNTFYGHSLPSADSRRTVLSFWWKNVHKTAQRTKPAQ